MISVEATTHESVTSLRDLRCREGAPSTSWLAMPTGVITTCRGHRPTTREDGARG